MQKPSYSIIAIKGESFEYHHEQRVVANKTVEARPIADDRRREPESAGIPNPKRTLRQQTPPPVPHPALHPISQGSHRLQVASETAQAHHSSRAARQLSIGEGEHDVTHLPRDRALTRPD